MSERALLTNSRLRCYRECARKHHFAYVDAYRPIVDAEPLRFGVLIHKALEAYWNCLVDTREMTEFGHDDYKYLAYEAASWAIEGKGIDAYEQARADEMILGYCRRWLQEDVPAYEVLGVETKFECALLNPATNLTPSRTWNLAGKVDAIVRRREDGKILVLEHKSSSESIDEAESHYWSRLALDHQVSAYVLGAESLGYRVEAILYDVLAKPQQRPFKATPIENRKFTKDGRLYAAQHAEDETPDEYRVRVRDAILSDLPRYFVRRAIPRTESQIRDFLHDAWAQSRTMRDLELAGASPRNPEQCWRYGECAYWKCCSTGMHPSEMPHDYKQTVMNPELEETK